MYARIAEHTFNSFPPKFATQTTQSICGVRSALLTVPRLDKITYLVDFWLMYHNNTIRSQSRSTFGPLSLMALRLLCSPGPPRVEDCRKLYAEMWLRYSKTQNVGTVGDSLNSITFMQHGRDSATVWAVARTIFPWRLLQRRLGGEMSKPTCRPIWPRSLVPPVSRICP